MIEYTFMILVTDKKSIDSDLLVQLYKEVSAVDEGEVRSFIAYCDGTQEVSRDWVLFAKREGTNTDVVVYSNR